MAAGYPSWKDLLSDISKELDIDLSSEHDLAGVAQWYINHNRSVRTQIARTIKQAFPPKAQVPEALQVLARLPLRHVWTTNYDKLIETAWERAGRAIAVRTRPEELTIPELAADTTLYKMHGSVDSPGDVVISKEDYELYRREKGAFFHLLTGHAIGLNFLFVGFSFTDANVAHLFGLLREIAYKVPPQHYAIVRRPPPPGSARGAQAKEKARRTLSRHNHWVADLKRYGLECVEVDSYDEIAAILQAVETRVARGSVFVSGSFPPELRDSQGGLLVREVAEGVGRIIAKQSARLVSGYGLEVGGAVIAGAFGEAYKAKYVNLDSALLLRPFPQVLPRGVQREEFMRHYREDMIRQSGVCVVVGGLKREGRDYVVAPGVLDEVAMAKAVGRPVLPLGATGGAAESIWREMMELSPRDRHGISKKDFAVLGEKPKKTSDYLAQVENLLGKLREI
ncbi:SIR2 family protein [Burkholderia pseudomallei]|uniref:SIR2 family protein n=1 Tax=Burkholderia pseudomallei TaxID=28450 RepID=UPI0022D39B9E|nr:SIR2 family protein [Burkholderia pseudomallei]MDA0558320.1 SIR2 family protein [Burkholderia pseudomallei]